ncbi:TetR/AcrR family transcriptional regulator [Streptomyces sp. NPDC059454]|jgi:AcrR family transcriptional regulator|uniref:TetR/AcrR family transcriptional regulator n=1 Tax=Streptomyces sp. NPDC059454 TaxID=3346836 RepID=UPI003680AEDA
MTSRFAHGLNPYSTAHVISTTRTLMRTDGLNVSLASIARRCGITRNFLYSHWKSVSALHLHALKAELAEAFITAARARPSDGTARGIVGHLTEVVRVVRRHPTTAAVARSAPGAFRSAQSATEAPLMQAATERISDLLHPLYSHGGVWGEPALASRPWKILWVARPAALCPEAVGDQDRENTLDAAFTELTLDLLAPWDTATP